jgi:hypothetical protein
MIGYPDIIQEQVSRKLAALASKAGQEVDLPAGFWA